MTFNEAWFEARSSEPIFASVLAYWARPTAREGLRMLTARGKRAASWKIQAILLRPGVKPDRLQP